MYLYIYRYTYNIHIYAYIHEYVYRILSKTMFSLISGAPRHQTHSWWLRRPCNEIISVCDVYVYVHVHVYVYVYYMITCSYIYIHARYIYIYTMHIMYLYVGIRIFIYIIYTCICVEWFHKHCVFSPVRRSSASDTAPSWWLRRSCRHWIALRPLSICLYICI